MFKKVLRGGAVGVFQGKILVKPGAQKTDGYQISQGLLLDETASSWPSRSSRSTPTTSPARTARPAGAVDETALFYLTSRGVPRRTAEELLVLAFLDEAIAEIEDEGLADERARRLGGLAGAAAAEAMAAGLVDAIWRGWRDPRGAMARQVGGRAERGRGRSSI